MKNIIIKSVLGMFLIFSTHLVQAQQFERDFPFSSGGTLEINNPYGKVYFKADKNFEDTAKISINSDKPVSENDLKIRTSKRKLKIEIIRQPTQIRIDFIVSLPVRSKVYAKTDLGEIRIIGNHAEIKAESNTGTIYTDVPLENLDYNFSWTATKPRFFSKIDLAKVQEKSAGRFVIKGKINEKTKVPASNPEAASTEIIPKNEKQRKKNEIQESLVKLKLATSRGIILLNVSPSQVPSTLRVRPLTKAAKAIINSGDSALIAAIRRAAPNNFSEYVSTLPPTSAPVLSNVARKRNTYTSGIKRVTVQITDINNRAISGLVKTDFEVSERGVNHEIISVEPTDAPFNLVLLLDISGSIDHYVDFIRKAARNFINTTSSQDRIAIITFNEDINLLSELTKNREKLSDSLDTFDAGGASAYYDALAYTLTNTLKSFQGERTAIVVLSDGDDNSSFLPFNLLSGSIQESGTLIYPLYVPSGLIASSGSKKPNSESIDPLRSRYIALTSKAQSEGETLAKLSGGVYYPISRLSELRGAYNDIVKQLRTAYTITYRSRADISTSNSSSRLKVKVKRKTAFVKLGPIVSVKNNKISQTINLQKKTSKNKLFIKTSFTKSTAFSQHAVITGEIDKVKYTQFNADKLRTYKLETCNVNKTPGAFLVSKTYEKIAVSRWISPKRTRSYPYERVYDTLAHKGKKVAVIPVVKDEGLGGDRDFIQWDTISLLSLLDVHVVLAYYSDAVKNPRKEDKITKQKFDNNFVKKKLEKVFNFKGTSREWNENEAKNLKQVFQQAKFAYRKIAKKTNTYIHNEDKLDERIKFAETPKRFIGYSRRRSRSAQNRELLTIQPNEALSTLSKAKVTINNALLGKYYFTVDETLIEPNNLFLIEAKHSSRSKLPSKNDIKDGLIKMMLYTNLYEVKINSKKINHTAAIRLTSNQIIGRLTSNMNDIESEKFFAKNMLKPRKKTFITKLFQEAKKNGFHIILENGSTRKPKKVK